MCALSECACSGSHCSLSTTTTTTPDSIFAYIYGNKRTCSSFIVSKTGTSVCERQKEGETVIIMGYYFWYLAGIKELLGPTKSVFKTSDCTSDAATIFYNMLLFKLLCVVMWFGEGIEPLFEKNRSKATLDSCN